MPITMICSAYGFHFRETYRKFDRENRPLPRLLSLKARYHQSIFRDKPTSASQYDSYAIVDYGSSGNSYFRTYFRLSLQHTLETYHKSIGSIPEER